MTSVAEAIRQAAADLAATSDTARLDSEVLMASALGTSRSDLLIRKMSDTAPGEFAAMVERRKASEPVAYIIGEQEFFGRSFTVNSDVLIPRSDSETLIEAALSETRDKSSGRVLDLGTGSGALLLTFLSEKDGWDGCGIDNSAGALAVAKANSARLHLEDRAGLFLRDWRQRGSAGGAGAAWTDGLGSFDLVIANPPYVESAARLDRDVREFEPHSALFAGPDGLDDYKVIVPQLREILSGRGIALFEIGATQAEALGKIAENNGFSAELRRDLANRPRCVVLRQ